MPDQSSAATEHAIMQEISAPLSTLPEDPVALVDVDFPVVLRGYDRVAVDDFVARTSQLVAELQATRSPEAAVRRALERVGEQISGILQRAHEAAGQITAQSRADAEDRLERSRQEAAEITREAEQRVKDLDADTDRIWSERHRIVDDARDLARQLGEVAESAGQRFPAAEEELPAGVAALPADAAEPVDEFAGSDAAELEPPAEHQPPFDVEAPSASQLGLEDDPPGGADIEVTQVLPRAEPEGDAGESTEAPPADPATPESSRDAKRPGLSTGITPAAQAANRRSDS